MPQFYRPLGWGVCGRQTFGQTLSRNLPPVSDGVVEGRGGFWHVRPWRQVELNDLMALYDLQYAATNGSVVRSEDYWRWMIGRKYAHVIWVACQGEAVRGYAFVKDHKILEIATHPAHPQALRALLGPGPGRGAGAGLPRGDRLRPGRPPGPRSLPRRLGQDRRPGRVRGVVLDVPHPRPRAVPQGDPPRAVAPGGRVGRRRSRWNWA